jgi:hypothetical protein
MDLANVPPNGEIKNITIISMLNQVSITWEHVSVFDTSDFRYLVALDGETLGVVTDLFFSISGISQGEHRLDIVPISPGVTALPNLHGDFYGRTAYLLWAPSGSLDLAGYNIYSNGGDGAIDYTNPVGSVSDVIIYPLVESPPTFGTGSGRLSLAGTWSGSTPINSHIQIKIFSSGLFKYYFGEWSEYISIQPQVSLPFGIILTFHDDPSLYAANDSYTTGVGVANYWTSEVLSENNYLYSVKAVDVAGNESPPLAEQPIAILYRPEPVSIPSVEWDGTHIALDWANPLQALQSVLIYSNFSPVYGLLQDTINERDPWHEIPLTVNPDEHGFSFTPLVDGVWKFYLRTQAFNGRISESAELLSIDTTGTPTSLALNAPEAFQVAQGVGGTLKASWSYLVAGGEDITGFKIYIDGVATVVSLPGDFFDSQVPQVSIVTNPQTIEVEMKVSAYVGSNELFSESLLITPDPDAPTFTGNLWGGSN